MDISPIATRAASTRARTSSSQLAAAGGAVFAILVPVALAIAPGPSSAGGVTVVEYFSTHRAATLWQACLIGFAIVFFIWFAETFSVWISSGHTVVVGAAVTSALYLVAIGAWESLGETYGRADIVDVPSEGYGDAHVLYDVGVGAAHLANFTAAAFVGATAAAMLTSRGHGRVLGWLGIALTLIQLTNAPLQIIATSHWSDIVGVVVFIAFLAWVFAASAGLVAAMRRSAVADER
jgi:hypothetical protein